jgi:hypothetical protein
MWHSTHSLHRPTRVMTEPLPSSEAAAGHGCLGGRRRGSPPSFHVDSGCSGVGPSRGHASASLLSWHVLVALGVDGPRSPSPGRTSTGCGGFNRRAAVAGHRFWPWRRYLVSFAVDNGMGSLCGDAV